MVVSEQEIRFQAKASNLGRLFQLLTNIFGQKKAMSALKKIDGEEVLGYFPTLGGQYVTLKASNCRVLPFMGKSDHAAAEIVFNVPSEEIVPLLNDVIRTKSSAGGLVKLVFKYLLPRKIKIKGSLGVALGIIKALMVGAHPMYVIEKRERKHAPKNSPPGEVA